MEHILVIEDDAAFRNMLLEALESRGWAASGAGSAEEGLKVLESGEFDLIITDVRLPGMSGIEAIPGLKKTAPKADVIVMTAYSAKESAVRAVGLGAADFFSKPFSLAELEVVVRRTLERRRLRGEVARLKSSLDRGGPASRIIGQSPAMAALREQILRLATLDTTVLVTGQSGTGKELVADTLHAASPRAGGPFIRVNCAAIPENLLESELFGAEKGAFTGASGARQGRFEQAHGGTLLLDEIGDMPLSIQPKLLRAVELKQVERLGGGKPRTVDVRIVAATNQDLPALIREKRFREDLYYRLNVASLRLPPLAERIQDVPQLAEFMLERINASLGLDLNLGREAVSALMEHDWPGNVRQLANALERAAISAPGPGLDGDDVRRALASTGSPTKADGDAPDHTGQPVLPGLDGSLPLKQALKACEKELVSRAMAKVGGRQTEAAQLLGVSPTNLWNKLQKHGLDPKSFTGSGS